MTDGVRAGRAERLADVVHRALAPRRALAREVAALWAALAVLAGLLAVTSTLAVLAASWARDAAARVESCGVDRAVSGGGQ